MRAESAEPEPFSPEAVTGELRVGVAGAGWAAEQHCASVSVLPGARVIAVADTRREQARALALQLGAADYHCVDRMLGAEELDAVIVATPPGQHRAPAVAALDRGVAAFIEKPIARSAEDGEAIVRAAERCGCVCAVGYQWRALDLLGRLRAQTSSQNVALMVSQGVGVTQARGWFYDPRESGRLISERASHHIDLQRAVGGEVAEVQAARGEVRLSGWAGQAGPVEDVVSLTLRFCDGALGAVHVAWTPEDYPGRQSLSICSIGGSLELDLDPQFVLRSQIEGHAECRASDEAPFLSQMRQFLDAVRAGNPDGVACTARDGADTLTVTLAAERALERGGLAIATRGCDR